MERGQRIYRKFSNCCSVLTVSESAQRPLFITLNRTLTKNKLKQVDVIVCDKGQRHKIQVSVCDVFVRCINRRAVSMNAANHLY